MPRKFKLLALLLVFVLMGTSTKALAKSRRRVRHDRPHRQRRVELITPSEAKEVVRRQLGTHNRTDYPESSPDYEKEFIF